MRNTKVCSPIAFVFVFILLSPTVLASSTDSKLTKIIGQEQSGFPTADFSANVSNGKDSFSEQFNNISQNITQRNRNGADDYMHIDFESSGGYANIRTTYRGNTDELPKEIADKLINLVESSRVFELQESQVAPSSSGPPDLLNYKLTIQDRNRRTSLSFNDATTPDSLRELLTFLQELSREQIMKRKQQP